MKKLLVALLTIMLVLSFTSCGKAVEDTETTSPQTTAEETAELAATIPHDHYENMCIDVNIHEDGYYSFYGDVDLYYYNGELSDVFIQNPTLLAFDVSSFYDNGFYFMKLTEGDKVIDELTEVAAALEAAGRSDLAEKVNDAIESIGLPWEQAST